MNYFELCSSRKDGRDEYQEMLSQRVMILKVVQVLKFEARLKAPVRSFLKEPYFLSSSFVACGTVPDCLVYCTRYE